ncbi:MAG: NADH:ubiquinone reductase (Na(+)-transporting) subunit C [Saprospiraceae bacterium]|nr:NADH:ubiquinone reductase (Na(+)-transporting) subunit C [Saprospiraceae bacterium]
MQQTNWYTIVFAAIMCLVVAAGLAGMKDYLAPQQKANELLFTKTQILQSVMPVDASTDVEAIFNENVKGFVLDNKGNIKEESTEKALQVNIIKENKKKDDDKQLPLFVFTNTEGAKNYILPTVGGGLWGWISSYVALDDQVTEIVGIRFDHETETPGLGANIKDDPNFYLDFVGEKIMDASGNLQAVTVKKGNGDPLNTDKADYEVDAISGATITGDGVTVMLKDDLEDYLPYFTKIKS